jgi:hypothetical protein
MWGNFEKDLLTIGVVGEMSIWRSVFVTSCVDIYNIGFTVVDARQARREELPFMIQL